MRGHRWQASASRRHLPAYHGTTFCGACGHRRHTLGDIAATCPGDIAATWTPATCANPRHAPTRDMRKPAKRGGSGQRLPVLGNGFGNAHCTLESAAVDGAAGAVVRVAESARRFGASGGAKLGSFCRRGWVRSVIGNWVRFVTTIGFFPPCGIGALSRCDARVLFSISCKGSVAPRR
jgi:hypothetical protein